MPPWRFRQRPPARYRWTPLAGRSGRLARPCLAGLARVHRDPGRALAAPEPAPRAARAPHPPRPPGAWPNIDRQRENLYVRSFASPVRRRWTKRGVVGTMRRERLIVRIYTTCPTSTASDRGSVRLRNLGSGRPARGAVDLGGPREVDHAAGVHDGFCVHGPRLSRVSIAMMPFCRSARGPQR